MNKQEVIKAFREARIAGEYMLSERRITWEEYAFVMVGFEMQLREMGEQL